MLNNVNFIFENVNWTGLEHCLISLGFQLSGWIINLRHLSLSM